jgi:hypothetical protein
LVGRGTVTVVAEKQSAKAGASGEEVLDLSGDVVVIVSIVCLWIGDQRNRSWK